MRSASTAAMATTAVVLSLTVGMLAVQRLHLAAAVAAAAACVGLLSALPRGYFSIGLPWVLIAAFFGSGLVFRIRETDQAATRALDLAAGFRVLLVAAVAISLLAYLASRTDESVLGFQLGLYAPLAAFVFWAAATTAWSVYPGWTLYRSVEFGVGVLLFAALSTRISSRGNRKNWYEDARTISGIAWLLYGSVLTAAVLSALLFPDRGIVGSAGIVPFGLEGVFPAVSRNGVGSIAAMLTLVLIARAAASGMLRGRYVVAIATCLALVAVSQTRSALLGLLAGLVVIAVSRRRYALVAIICAILAIVTVAVPEIESGTSDYLRRGQTTQQLQSLTGRVDYWNRVTELAGERPIEGFGAYAAGRFLVARDFDPTLSSTHGTWPEVLIGQGVVGLALLTVAVLATVIWLIRGVRDAGTSNRESWLLVEATAVLAFLLVRSIFSVALIWHPAVDFLTVLFIADVYRRSVRH